MIAHDLLHYGFYDGEKDNAVADYAFVSRLLNPEENKAYSIQSTVDYEL